MLTFECVVCAVDLSVPSANALRVAAAWARAYDAWLHVLHVAPLPQPMMSPTGLLAALPVRPLPEIKAQVEQFVGDTLGPTLTRSSMSYRARRSARSCMRRRARTRCS